MKKIQILLSVTLIFSNYIFAQVKDISVTVSPAVEYTLWDDKAGLEDALTLGGKVGFGFGEFVELRATYMQAVDLQTNFENFGLVNYSNGLFIPRDVKLTRIGGEFKANFGTKTKLNPYFTLGTGVQYITLENEDENEQIFATLGLGAKFNIGKRAVFTLEAKNTTFNFNSGSRLLTADDQANFGVTNSDFETERLSNWSAMTSLEFYLGGRRPGELTELDKAYLNSFSGGFKGLRIVLEPSMANIKFDTDSNYRDTWLLGGSLGVDFNDYVGLRAFYYKASNNEEISTDFDNLQMFGGEFKARLNVPRGIVPFLSIGGGYIDTSSDYLGKDGLTVDDSYFASGGLGLNVPLTKGFQVFGGVKAILTSSNNEEDLQTPQEIQTHTMYNFGLRFELGKKSESVSSVYNENLSNALYDQQLKNDQKIENLKAEYTSKIKDLETQLQDAYKNKDVNRAVEILEEKKEVEAALKEVKVIENVSNESKTDVKAQAVNKSQTISNIKEEPIIKLSPAEFESLIDRILNQVETKSEVTNKQIPIEQLNNGLDNSKAKEIDLLNQRIDQLEKLLLDIYANKIQQQQPVMDLNSSNDEKFNAMSTRILDKLNELNRKIDRSTDKIQTKQSANVPQTIIIKPSETVKPDIKDNTYDKYEVLQNENDGINKNTNSIFSKLEFKDANVFTGGVFGDETLPVIGLRLNYTIDSTKVLFVPELFIGVTDPVSYGLSANGIIPMNIKNTTIKPYAGAGFGFMRVYDESKFNTNIILGSYLNLLSGKLYVDYTTRNFLDYNQISAGYKFNF